MGSESGSWYVGVRPNNHEGAEQRPSTDVSREPRTAAYKDAGVAGNEDREANPVLAGGIATKEDALIPVCKHILAAALCDVAPGLFGDGMKVKEISMGELAAWAAGWGET